MAFILGCRPLLILLPGGNGLKDRVVKPIHIVYGSGFLPNPGSLWRLAFKPLNINGLE